VVQKLLGNLELGVSNNLQPILQITCIASGSDESLSLSGDKADPSAVVDKFAENTKLLVGLRVMLYKRGGPPANCTWNCLGTPSNRGCGSWRGRRNIIVNTCGMRSVICRMMRRC
jgi:hypothetical protein